MECRTDAILWFMKCWFVHTNAWIQSPTIWTSFLGDFFNDLYVWRDDFKNHEACLLRRWEEIVVYEHIFGHLRPSSKVYVNRFLQSPSLNKAHLPRGMQYAPSCTKKSSCRLLPFSSSSSSFLHGWWTHSILSWKQCHYIGSSPRNQRSPLKTTYESATIFIYWVVSHNVVGCKGGERPPNVHGNNWFLVVGSLTPR